MKSKRNLFQLFLFVAMMGLWIFFKVKGGISTSQLLVFVALILLAVFVIFLAMRRFRSEQRGEPAEDELSKKIRQKAAASSFYISLYFWLMLSIFIDEGDDLEAAIGAGIIGMSVIFAMAWFYHRKKGLKE